MKFDGLPAAGGLHFKRMLPSTAARSLPDLFACRSLFHDRYLASIHNHEKFAAANMVRDTFGRRRRLYVYADP